MQHINRDISVLKERISQYLDFKRETKASFYKNTGVSNGVLSQNNGLSEDNIMRFLSFYRDINPIWFLLGHGSMIIQEDIKCEVNKSLDFNTYKNILFEKDNEIKELNREIGKLQFQVDILKKENPSSAYRIAAESELKYKGKGTK